MPYINMKIKHSATTLMVIILSLFLGVKSIQAGEAQKKSVLYKGKLIQMFKSGGYTYLEYESEGKRLWAASRFVVANIGNIIEFKDPLIMKGFYSKSLKRKFDQIYFAGFIRAVGKYGQPSMNSMKSMVGHKKTDPNSKLIVVKAGSVKKAEDGLTISECFNNKESLNGKEIYIRAIVVKVSSKIKGRNWVHIRDGSGKEGSNDITFTTKDTLSPGDIILVKGIMTLNKDIGSGYIFPVFLADPEIKKEGE